MEGEAVRTHLTHNVRDYYDDVSQRQRIVDLADYLADRLETIHPEDAGDARVLRDLVRNERVG